MDWNDWFPVGDGRNWKPKPPLASPFSPCEPVPETAGEHYAQIKLHRQKKGLTLDENDLWTPATSLALGTTLVSRDSDFRQIDGLNVEEWTH